MLWGTSLLSTGTCGGSLRVRDKAKMLERIEVGSQPASCAPTPGPPKLEAALPFIMSRSIEYMNHVWAPKENICSSFEASMCLPSSPPMPETGKLLLGILHNGICHQLSITTASSHGHSHSVLLPDHSIWLSEIRHLTLLTYHCLASNTEAGEGTLDSFFFYFIKLFSF